MISRLRIREFVRKEFIQLFRDRRNRPILITMPLVQILLFGYVVTTDVRDIRVGFLDLARTAESRMLYDSFNANRTFRVVSYADSPDEIERKLLRGEIEIAVKVPPDFTDRIRSGETAGVQVLADGTMSNMASIRIAYTMLVLDKYNAERIREIIPEELDYGRIDARIRTWYNPNLDSRNFYVPGIVAFLIMLISLLFTSMAIIKEREAGTMEQLIVTPMKPSELILGKTIPYIIISIIQMIAVTAFAVYWFEIPVKGNLLLLFAATCVFLLSSLGVGLFISTISATQQQAMMTTFFFAMPFFMFSGFVFPISNMPVAVRWLAYLNPLMYFLIIIRGIFLKGVGLAVLWPQFLALLAIGTVVFTGAVKRFHKRLD
ncbi:MAG: ABC transporter permease [Syntrophales bacterium]|nr:ABC transporter permease [Syntrophales bacterium]HPL62687.1 ABC transporter permease [Syntrophales bacterium]